MEVVDRPVAAADLLATLCKAVGVDPELENINEDRRPIKIAEGAPIAEILA
jgi:arylsulfatase A-like enzyme